jgi:hypothetical protein
MTTTSFSLGRGRRGVSVLGGLVLLGAVLGACGSSNNNAASSTTTTSSGTSTTTGGTSGSTSVAKIEALASSLKSAEKATFKAVYTITNAGSTQTVTIEQSPPKSLFSTKGGDVIDTGSATYYCTDSAQSTCLSAGTSNPLASLTALFSPQTVLTELNAVQAEAAAHAAGYNVSFSSGSYAGQDTTCANVTGTGTNVKYCVTKQGVLAYASSNGGTFSLTSFSSSAPASDFSLPPGATVMTIPSGSAS